LISMRQPWQRTDLPCSASSMALSDSILRQVGHATLRVGSIWPIGVLIRTYFEVDIL
jgi:hypothetical protein